ncbi:MAG: thiamine phosphate synthase [Gammaproteobacteria bacterium]|nr:thiamine phosphate synthase [Gammaproteobacteria bacterium]
MNNLTPCYGLYIITDYRLPDQSIIEKTQQSLQAGASIVQLRIKSDEPLNQVAFSLAQDLLSLCHKYQARLIINDDLALAQMINADGVHLGKQDTNIRKARNLLGKQKMIGISCYNSLQRALQAQSQGADYVAFGRFFNSNSKPEATPANINLLAEAKRRLDVPVVAIGGITPDNGRQLIDAGADFLAVIHGIYAQDNPGLQTTRYLNLFKKDAIR